MWMLRACTDCTTDDLLSPLKDTVGLDSARFNRGEWGSQTNSYSPSAFIICNGTWVYWFSSTRPLSDTRKCTRTLIKCMQNIFHPKYRALDNVLFRVKPQTCTAHTHLSVNKLLPVCQNVVLTSNQFHKAFACISQSQNVYQWDVLNLTEGFESTLKTMSSLSGPSTPGSQLSAQ